MEKKWKKERNTTRIQYYNSEPPLSTVGHPGYQATPPGFGSWRGGARPRMPTARRRERLMEGGGLAGREFTGGLLAQGIELAIGTYPISISDCVKKY